MASHRPRESFSGDEVGIVIAAVCLIHCLCLSLFALLVPWLLGRLGLGEGLHQALAFLSLLIGVATLLPGYQVHRQAFVLGLGLCGISLLLAGALVPQELCCYLWLDSPDVPLSARLTPLTIIVSSFTPLGCCLLVAAHLMNRRRYLDCQSRSRKAPT